MTVLSHDINHYIRKDCLYIDIIVVKLTFEMLTVHGQQHSFLTQKWMFL